MQVDEIEWHDGVYLGHSFSANYGSASEITLVCAIYPEQVHTSKRATYEIKCSGVKRFVSSCGLAELISNKSAGNINHGYQNGDTLYIYLFGGYIEIEAEQYEAKAC